MLSTYPVTEIITTRQDLSALDKNQLIDLLQHRTRLLLTASKLFVREREYIKILIEEVREVQEAIRSRN